MAGCPPTILTSLGSYVAQQLVVLVGCVVDASGSTVVSQYQGVVDDAGVVEETGVDVVVGVVVVVVVVVVSSGS